MLTPAGVLTVVAGTGVQGFAGDDGPAIAALLDSPLGVALDASGGLIIADSHNGKIRRVDPGTGLISSIAQARLPVALTFDSAGRVVYSDAALHEVLRVEVSGAQTVLAGSGVQGSLGDGGLATAAGLDSPAGVAFDLAGNLYIADTHNHAVRRVDAVTGLISTVAIPLGMSLPRGLVMDASGDLYIVDAGNQRIRRVDAVTGAVTTVAGSGAQGFAGDGGIATAAELNSPRGLSLSPTGAATFSDSANGRVRWVDANGNLQTVAGSGAAGVGAARAPTVTTLAQSGTALLAGVSSSAAGSPTGSVTLLDGGAAVASATLAGGSASFNTSGFSAGSHTLQAVYGGSASFLSSTSVALVVTIAGASAGDFTLTSSGSAGATVVGGSSGSYGFVVTPTGAPLVSRVVLSVSGLPVGATASFAPGFLPPPSGAVPFTLTVQTVATAAYRRIPGGVVWAGVLVGVLFWRRRRRVGMVVALLMLAGCGARVNTGSAGAVAPVSYNLTVTATGTSATGASLVHSVGVVLTVQ